MVDGTSLGQVVALEEACFHAEDVQTLEGDGVTHASLVPLVADE